MAKSSIYGRTKAQIAALTRDEFRCQWCLVVLERLTPATDAHHIFRPRNDYDRPEYIISLCHEHHLGYRHIKGTITDQDIIDKVMIPYIWQGENLTPKRARFSRPKEEFPKSIPQSPEVYE